MKNFKFFPHIIFSNLKQIYFKLFKIILGEFISKVIELWCTIYKLSVYYLDYFFLYLFKEFFQL